MPTKKQLESKMPEEKPYYPPGMHPNCRKNLVLLKPGENGETLRRRKNPHPRVKARPALSTLMKYVRRLATPKARKRFAANGWDVSKNDMIELHVMNLNDIALYGDPKCPASQVLAIIEIMNRVEGVPVQRHKVARYHGLDPKFTEDQRIALGRILL